MREIVLATNNQHKVHELTKMLFGHDVEIRSMLDFPSIPPVEEDGTTFEQNARKKALYITQKLSKYALADDSGLVVDMLEGRPGVYSARYAGLTATFRDNNEKLLVELARIPDERRTALFVCVVACSNPAGRVWLFRGELKGRISREERGRGGFGYDPVFIPDGYDKTLAELDPEEKNRISHRGLALAAFRKQLDIIFYADQTPL